MGRGKSSAREEALLAQDAFHPDTLTTGLLWCIVHEATRSVREKDQRSVGAVWTQVVRRSTCVKVERVQPGRSWAAKMASRGDLSFSPLHGVERC